MIIQCSIVATCTSGLVIQAKYITGGNTLPVKKTKACYDSKLSLKTNAQKVAEALQGINSQAKKDWQCNVLECSGIVFFTQEITLNSVKF